MRYGFSGARSLQAPAIVGVGDGVAVGVGVSAVLEKISSVSELAASPDGE